MKEYTKQEQYKILCQSAVYIDNTSSYRIEYVPEYELWESGEENILMTDENEYDGSDISFGFNDIDLNRPDVSTYKLVLSNPILEQ